MNGMQLQHVNVLVDDIDEAHRFYAGLLGLESKPAPEMGFPARFYKINDGQEIHVNQLADVRPERAHFALRVDDFTAVFHRLHDAGVLETETWGKPRRLPGGVMQCFARDPAGNLIEIGCGPDQEVDEALFGLDVFESDQVFFAVPPD